MVPGLLIRFVANQIPDVVTEAGDIRFHTVQTLHNYRYAKGLTKKLPTRL